MTKAEKQERKDEALAWLRTHLKKGDTVYTAMRHTNRMGTYRVASHFLICNGSVIRIDSYVCSVLEQRWDDRHEGVAYPNHQPPDDVAERLSHVLHGPRQPACKCEERAHDYYALPAEIRLACKTKPPKKCWHRPGYTLRHEWL